jgi:hypothetical protein
MRFPSPFIERKETGTLPSPVFAIETFTGKGGWQYSATWAAL